MVFEVKWKIGDSPEAKQYFETYEEADSYLQDIIADDEKVLRLYGKDQAPMEWWLTKFDNPTLLKSSEVPK